ncbi:hypothetical protein DJ68_07825 [Halorubrum sp. C3]|nr:hypothetical protein DJ68_07825 [Halorubrum sp. C3]
MRHEIQFLLEDVLGPVVDARPADHPLFRVNRDDSTVYETGSKLDMQAPIQTRKKQLQRANFVGVASQSTDPTPAGPGSRYELQMATSLRLEGMSAAKRGHIDHPDVDAVPFETLFQDVFEAAQGAMSYPDVGRPGVSYLDLTITNIDDSQSDHSDFHRAEFDMLFRGYTDS